MTTIARAEIPNHHTDVVCPPNQDAECAGCGNTLAEHTGDVPDTGSECPDGGPFRLAGGEQLDCPRMDVDPVCGADVCTEHSPSDDLIEVGITGHVHHRSCALSCGDCRPTLAELEGWLG